MNEGGEKVSVQYMQHAREVTVRSSFFLVVVVTIWILMHRKEMGKRQKGDMLYRYLSQPLKVLSLLFSTAPSSMENRDVVAASPAPQLEK